ncbi:hypothetical protein CEP53_005823 [Fusarium sp. AF-6]|nr:hypothetical protein CEP53_005823 [Fusarium sp. AF-6]
MSTAEYNTNRLTLRPSNLPLVHHEIIENGDVILVIGQDSIKIQLSSSFLCLVSPVFKAMLTSPMIEGQRLRERGDRPVEYVLLNDSAEATLHAFKYLYGSDPKMLNLNPDEILQVAVFVDKWGLAERFQFAAMYWTMTPNECSYEPSTRDKAWKLLLASYWFRIAWAFAMRTGQTNGKQGTRAGDRTWNRRIAQGKSESHYRDR